MALQAGVDIAKWFRALVGLVKIEAPVLKDLGQRQQAMKPAIPGIHRGLQDSASDTKSLELSGVWSLNCAGGGIR
jgi:hypothetical protein